MADLGGSFDPSDVPEDENRRDFDLIPSSWQTAQIIESSVEPTKSGSGDKLSLTWEIVEGKFERRKIWQTINIRNNSAEAERIGQRELADICEATGAGRIRDSEELHFKPCLIRVGLSKKQEGYEQRNEVKAVKASGGSGTAAPQRQPETRQTTAPPPRQAAAGGGTRRPWG